MQVPMIPGRILKRAVKLYPNNIAIVDGEVRWTYAQVQRRVNQVINGFNNLKCSPGSRVALLDYNSYRYLELYFGMAQSDKILLPLNIRLSVDEYVYIFKNSMAEALVFHADFKPIIDKVRKRIENITHYYIAEGASGEEWISGTYEDLILAASDSHSDFEPQDENATLNLYYTSGTTGQPKGVMLTHRNIYANALTTIISFRLEDTTVWYHIAPLFHLADAFFIWSVTYQGGRHVIQREFDPREVLNTIQEEKITATMMVPTMVNFLLDDPTIDQYDLSSLQWIMIGGAPMSPANAKRMMGKLGCQYISAYGLTETTPLLAVGNLKATLLNEPEDTKIDFQTRTGFEAVGVDLRVVDGDGKDIPWDGETVGEIIARGDNVMKGYWKLPEETAGAIKDGYFYTGDLANINSEGYLLIVDRAKDIIISGGENISSVEVENSIYAHPDVLECAVIAIPDEKWGEVPKAFVTLKEGSKVTSQELINHCREKLARFKVPKQIEYVKELPKTGSGKIRKTELRLNKNV